MNAALSADARPGSRNPLSSILNLGDSAIISPCTDKFLPKGRLPMLVTESSYLKKETPFRACYLKCTFTLIL